MFVVVSVAICAVESMFILDDGREYEYLNQMKLGKCWVYLIGLTSINFKTISNYIYLNYFDDIAYKNV